MQCNATNFANEAAKTGSIALLFFFPWCLYRLGVREAPSELAVARAALLAHHSMQTPARRAHIPNGTCVGSNWPHAEPSARMFDERAGAVDFLPSVSAGEAEQARRRASSTAPRSANSCHTTSQN